MKGKVPIFLIFLFGLSILLYPVVSHVLAHFTQTRVISTYEEAVSQLSAEEKTEEIKKANEYNSNLVTQETEVIEGVSYVDLLNVGEIMAYLKIPKISVNLPIYHGTSDAVLQRGIGHMEKSSLPVGGDSTHSVLTGHTGLPQASLLTDLTKVEIGDEFYIHLFDEVLAYQVDQIKVVLPEETSDLQIIEGEDYVTLITCTPYGVNSHRLLVRGTRIDDVEPIDEELSSIIDNESVSPKDEEETQSDTHLLGYVMGAMVVVGVFILFIIKKRKKGDRR